jgi:hypothetical protein
MLAACRTWTRNRHVNRSCRTDEELAENAACKFVRYVSSGTYYARLRVKGKLIRIGLKTGLISVAKLRPADGEKTECEATERQKNPPNAR